MSALMKKYCIEPLNLLGLHYLSHDVRVTGEDAQVHLLAGA